MDLIKKIFSSTIISISPFLNISKIQRNKVTILDLENLFFNR